MLMRVSSRPRLLSMAVFAGLFSVFAGLAYGTYANSQNVEPDAKATPNFSRMTIKPAAVAFPALIFPRSASTSETKTFSIENTGRGTTDLTVNVGGPTGKGAAAFTILSGEGALPAIPPGQSATVTVQFKPLADGASIADVLVTAEGGGVRGPTSRNVRLSGVARGPIPTPGGSATATATATATSRATATATATSRATATATASPSATATPGTQATNKNSSNAPGVIINGKTVTAYIPQGSDDNSTTGIEQVVIEAAASPLASPVAIASDRVNSCTPAKTGEVVCSGQGGTVDLIPAAGGTPTIPRDRKSV